MIDGKTYRCNLCATPLGFEGAERGVGLRVVPEKQSFTKTVIVTPLEGSDFHLCNRCHECVAQGWNLTHTAAAA